MIFRCILNFVDHLISLFLVFDRFYQFFEKRVIAQLV